MNTIERMEAIKAKFLKLKASDPKFKLDGAKEHKYELGTRLNEEQLAEFETRNKLRLPEDYRWLLLNMGNGGKVGPSLCCYSLNLKKKISGDFPLKYGEMYSMNEFEEEYEEYDDACKAIDIASKKARKGQITIGYDTDHAEMNLVLKGPAAGTVWSVDFGTDSYGAFPISSPYRDDEPMTFADWFEIWLDEALEDSYLEYGNYIDFDSCEHISIPEDEMSAYKLIAEAKEKEEQIAYQKEMESAELSFEEWVFKMNEGVIERNIETAEKMLEFIESGKLLCTDLQRNYVRNDLMKKIEYFMRTPLCTKSQYPVWRSRLLEESKKARAALPYPAPEDKTMVAFNAEKNWQGFPYEITVWNKDMYLRAANSFAWYTLESKENLNEALRVVESALIYEDVIKQFAHYCIYDTQVRILLALGKKEEAFEVVDSILTAKLQVNFCDFDDFKVNEEFLTWRNK